MEKEPTMTDVLESISDFATRIENRLGGIETRLDRIEQKHDDLEKFVKTNMVTKAYLDDRHFDKEGDLVAAVKTEDQKINAVVTKLEEKKVLSSPEAHALSAIAPFSAA